MNDNDMKQNQVNENELPENEIQENEIQENVKKESAISHIKASFTSKKFKGGAYTTIITTIVVVIVLFINIIASQLDWKADLSSSGIYTLTSDTKDCVKAIKDDVTIYYMVQTGSEDDMVKRIVDKYDSLSDKVKVEYKDPVLNPSFSSQYVEDKVTNNSVIVVNATNGKTRYIDNADLFEYDIDYTNYTQTPKAVDVEGQVTSALQYVTNENLPVMYTVEGHGETALADTLNSAITKANITKQTLNTLTVKSIPEDCSTLVINAPQTDYSEDEVKMIKDYLEAGGDAIILVDYSAQGLTNFNSLLNYYGVGLVDGIVIETDANHIMGQYVNNLIPEINSHDITDSIQSKGAFVVAPAAKGIKILDTARNTIEVKPLLTTTNSSFSKIDMNSNSVTKEDGDIDGPFNLGVAITEKYKDAETKIVVLGSSYIIDEQMLSYPSLGNSDLFINSVNYTTSQENQTVSIPSKSFQPGQLTITAAQANFWAAVVIIIIPVLILILGGMVTIRRRKR